MMPLPKTGVCGLFPGRTKAKGSETSINNAPGLALNQELTQDEFEESEGVDLVLEADRCLCMAYLVHGSEPNRSDRLPPHLRFMPTSSATER